jgi:hypothetical protein
MKTFSLALSVIVFATAACGAKELEAVGEFVLAKEGFVPPVGTILTKRSGTTMKDSVIRFESAGRKSEGRTSITETSEETTEVLSPTRIRRILLNKNHEEKTTINGADQEPTKIPDPLFNIPVFLDKSGGKWAATLASGEKPDELQQKALAKLAGEFNSERNFALYGGGVHKPGDEWKVDGSKVGYTGMTDLSGEYVVKFVEVREFQGKKCAVLKIEIDTKGKREPEGNGQPLNMHVKADSTVFLSINDLVDLDGEISGTITSEGSLPHHVLLKIEGPMELSQQISIKDH